ncbi:MAG: hypothetical protein CNLJKLNK_00381 [Holosporales bacterium]
MLNIGIFYFKIVTLQFIKTGRTAGASRHRFIQFYFFEKNAISSKKVYSVKEKLTFLAVYWLHRGDSFGGTGIKCDPVAVVIESTTIQ